MERGQLSLAPSFFASKKQGGQNRRRVDAAWPRRALRFCPRGNAAQRAFAYPTADCPFGRANLPFSIFDGLLDAQRGAWEPLPYVRQRQDRGHGA
jgi:hypothetical protein